MSSDLHGQLVRLGDMIGDGLHHEPGGQWILRDYNRVAKALGLIKPKARVSRGEIINKTMAERVKVVVCGLCSGPLKLARSGSLRARCTLCGAKFQLMRFTKNPPAGKV